MRSGILSDDYTKENFPAFFDQPFRKGRIRKPGIPYYDLYATAQVTMDNVYEAASELVENYVPPVANMVANVPPAAPSEPETFFDPALEVFRNIGLPSPFPPLDPQIDQYGSMNPFGYQPDEDDTKAHRAYSPPHPGIAEASEAPPRSLPTLRPDFGYNPSK